MPKIAYITASGDRIELDADVGSNVMQAALVNNLAGIQGDCSDAGQCATCHCYVDDAWLAKLPAVEEMEDAMLDCTAEPRQPNSRLSCALTVTAEMDGLVVRLPATQS